MLYVPQKVFGYAPPKEWLILYAKDKGLVSEHPVTSDERVAAMKEALIDIIEEAGLGSIAQLKLVRIKDMPIYAIVLANNWNNVRASKEQVLRLKGVFKTKANPSWHEVYSQ